MARAVGVEVKGALRVFECLPPRVVLRSQAGPPAWGDAYGVQGLRPSFAALRPQPGAPLPRSLRGRQKVAGHVVVMGCHEVVIPDQLIVTCVREPDRLYLGRQARDCSPVYQGVRAPFP